MGPLVRQKNTFSTVLVFLQQSRKGRTNGGCLFTYYHGVLPILAGNTVLILRHLTSFGGPFQINVKVVIFWTNSVSVFDDLGISITITILLKLSKVQKTQRL